MDKQLREWLDDYYSSVDEFNSFTAPEEFVAFAALDSHIAELEAQLKALRKEKDDVADYLETMTARCVEDTALIGVLKNQLKAGEQITDLLQESYNGIYQQLSETRKQLKTAKRDAILEFSLSRELEDCMRGGFLTEYLAVVNCCETYANSIESNK